MTINAFSVSYNDFELDTIINPDEFDVNFADIMIRMNQLIDVANHITDGANVENEDGTTRLSDGSEIIDIGPILPFTATKLQAFLEQVLARLTSSGVESGASYIGSYNIPGVIGSTVQEQLESLKLLLDELQALHVSDNTAINERATVIERDVEDLNTRVEGFEADVSQLNGDKMNKSDAYTKSQTDMEIAQLEAQVYNELYTKEEADNLLDEKTNNDGNHAGTWQGINVSDIANVVGASDVAIQVAQPAPRERMLWFNPSTNEYTIYLNGQWRINSRPTQIKKVHNRVVLGVDTDTVGIGIPNFNPNLDAFIVMQNSTFIAEGFDYTVSGSTITNATPWNAGTVFDFVAFIASPVV